MNDTVLILSPDPKDLMYDGRWVHILKQLTEKLRCFNIDVTHAPWTTALHNTSRTTQLVLPLLAWGYQRSHPLWLEICKEWQKRDVLIHNPPNILQWNSDKHYLDDLYKQGAPVVPTFYCDNISYSKLNEALVLFDVDMLVLKPTVSATAYKTSLWKEGESITDPPSGSCIIQPYLPSIVTEGEISLIFIDGQFSHALRKTPAAGDFRVQPEFGGHLAHYVPDQSVLQTAKKILKSIGSSLLYARIDIVLNNLDEWELLEAELIEPDLFLDFDKTNGKLLGDAIFEKIKKESR